MARRPLEGAVATSIISPPGVSTQMVAEETTGIRGGGLLSVRVAFRAASFSAVAFFVLFFCLFVFFLFFPLSLPTCLCVVVDSVAPPDFDPTPPLTEYHLVVY